MEDINNPCTFGIAFLLKCFDNLKLSHYEKRQNQERDSITVGIIIHLLELITAVVKMAQSIPCAEINAC